MKAFLVAASMLCAFVVVATAVFGFVLPFGTSLFGWHDTAAPEIVSAGLAGALAAILAAGLARKVQAGRASRVLRWVLVLTCAYLFAGCVAAYVVDDTSLVHAWPGFPMTFGSAIGLACALALFAAWRNPFSSRSDAA